MFCTKCGFKLETDARFCSSCGAAVEAEDVSQRETPPMQQSGPSSKQNNQIRSEEPVMRSQEQYMPPPIYCPYAPKAQSTPTLKKKPKIWIPIVASVAALAVIASVLLFVDADRCE